MKTKKYSSYATIEKDLEIISLEKQIHYNKLLFSIEKTKESILPSKSITLLGDLYDKTFMGTYGTIFKLVIPYIFNWYINRKRSN